MLLVMHTIDFFRQNRSFIEELIGYSFLEKGYLERAFIHKSFINEGNGLVTEHNERLEFLGDAVLDLVVSSFLYEKFPDEKEGVLSEFRSKLVDAKALLLYLKRLEVSRFLVLGKGEMGSIRNSSIFADLFEAILGAMYLDGGLSLVKEFFLNRFSKEIEEILDTPWQNPKALLQDYAQKHLREQPVYEVVRENGSDHEKEFTVVALIQGEEFGMGIGSSKKEATKKAAEDALKRLEGALCL